MTTKKIDTEKLAWIDIWEMQELYRTIAGTNIWMSWGIHKPTKFSNWVLWFKVQGCLHTWWVLLSVDWDDTFRITLGTPHKNFVSETKGVYLDQLIDTIDKLVETK